MKNKKSSIKWRMNRSDRIRTCGLYVPNVALYQAEPHSDLQQKICTAYFLSGKIRNLPSGKFPATEKGLEPLLTESESAVLPITPFRIVTAYGLSLVSNMVIISNFEEKSSTFLNFFIIIFYSSFF